MQSSWLPFPASPWWCIFQLVSTSWCPRHSEKDNTTSSCQFSRWIAFPIAFLTASPNPLWSSSFDTHHPMILKNINVLEEWLLQEQRNMSENWSFSPQKAESLRISCLRFLTVFLEKFSLLFTSSSSWGEIPSSTTWSCIAVWTRKINTYKTHTAGRCGPIRGLCPQCLQIPSFDRSLGWRCGRAQTNISFTRQKFTVAMQFDCSQWPLQSSPSLDNKEFTWDCWTSEKTQKNTGFVCLLCRLLLMNFFARNFFASKLKISPRVASPPWSKQQRGPDSCHKYTKHLKWYVLLSQSCWELFEMV